MGARTDDDSDDCRRATPRCRHAATPDQLVPLDDTVKVTFAPSHHSVAFFEREAAKQRVPYQQMIRALVDAYARRMGMSGAAYG